MTTNETKPRPAFPWPARARFRVGNTRKQRQSQYTQQTNVLFFVILAAVLFGLVVVWINYQSAGSSKQVSCSAYPHYCVPLAGGGTSATFAANETASSRTLDANSHGAEGVVRGIVDETVPFIGNPSAPIEFAVVSAYSCSHCQTYHPGDLERVIEDFALSGRAVVRSVLTARYEQDLTATQATFCAGEQGAYWEMSNELYRMASAESITSAFTVPRLKVVADDMGLDGDALVACLTSDRYRSAVETNELFATDNGVTGTPTVLMRVAGSDEWTIILRSYDSIKKLIETGGQP